MFYQNVLDFIEQYIAKIKLKKKINKFTKKISFLIVGPGKMGAKHSQHFIDLNFNLLGFGNTKKSFFLTSNNKFNSFDEIKKNYKFIVISTPNYNHKDYIEHGLKLGKYIFVDKPLVINKKEYLYLENLNLENEKIFIAYNLKYQNNSIFFKKIIEKNKLNGLKIKKINVFWRRKLAIDQSTKWTYNRHISGGGIVLDWGCHVLNLFQYFIKDLGEYNIKSNIKKTKVLNGEIDAEADVLLTFDDFLLKINLSWLTDKKKALSFEIIYENGMVLIWNKSGEIYLNSNGKNKKIYSSKINNMYNYFSNNVLEGKGFDDFKNHEFVTNCIDKIYLSSEN